MTKYLVERRFHVSQDEMTEVSTRSKRIAVEQFPEITWHHSHVFVDDAGTVKTFCVYEAPSEDVVRAHAKELGVHDVEGVYEIAGDVTPDDFPLN
jgi:ligand-binding SRPBCC domain-containing protein